MADGRGGDAVEGRHAAAVYLTSMLEELSPLAQHNGLPIVAYLLDMALMEARSAAGHSAVPPADRSR